MPCTGDDPALHLALDGARYGCGVAARHQPVIFPPQNQGRRFNERKAARESRIAERPEDAGRGLGGTRLLDRPFDRVGAGRNLLELAVDVRIGRHEPGDIVRPLRPGIGGGILLVEQSERSDQREPLDLLRPKRGHLGRERAAHRAADQIGTLEPRLVDERTGGKHPIEMAVEHGVPAVAARETGQRRYDYAAALRKSVEKRHPPRQAAVARQKADGGPPALAPNPRGKPVDVDRRCFRFVHATRSVRPKIYAAATAHSAAAAGMNAGTAARWRQSMGCGHQRFSHSRCSDLSRGITLSANRRVLYLASFVAMFPNCIISMSWPTLSVVASSCSCSTTSSGEPTITYPLSTMPFMSRASACIFCAEAALVEGPLGALPWAAILTWLSMPARWVASVT